MSEAILEPVSQVAAGKVECRLCGEKVHSVVVHLRNAHSEDSASPCTNEEYMEKFPDAPLISEAALNRIKERKREFPSSTVAPASKGPLGQFEPMAKLFGLGRLRAAQNANGDDVMIEVCQDVGFEEHIPTMDPNYVYPIETLKSILMAFALNMPVYTYGHAGVGKSTLFEQVCGATRRRMVRVQHTINTEESHIVGQWTVKKFKDPQTGTYLSETVFELGPLPLAMKYGWTYLADEYDRGHPSVLSVYQAVLEGKSLLIKEADEANRIIEPHPNFRFAATGNTNGSGDETGLYQATVIQDAATFERFGVVERIEYMARKQEIAMLKSQARLIDEDAERVRDYCERMRESFPQVVSLTIGPRVAINISKIGLAKKDFKRGVELAYANRLPESERKSAMDVAQRIFG